MKQRMEKLVVLGLVAFLWSVPSAGAHHVWLNATRYTIEALQKDAKAKTILYFGWGDFYPVHDFLREGQVERVVLKAPSGEREIQVPNSGFNEQAIELSENGTYVVAASLKPSFVTDVMEDGKMRVLLKPTDEVPKGAEVLESKYGSQFAKMLVTVGEPAASLPGPVGHALEIMLLVNPATLREGDYLSFRILFQGEPLRAPYADPKIYATYLGFSTGKGVFASTAEATKDGVVRLKLLRSGVWQIYVEHVLPPTPELAGKAGKIEYKASLTFEVP